MGGAAGEWLVGGRRVLSFIAVSFVRFPLSACLSGCD